MAITKYLFLDIDGVLNHKDWYKNINKYDYKRREFDPECVNRVKKTYFGRSDYQKMSI